MEMLPWKRACAGSIEVEGMCSRDAREKPPVLASDMILHAEMVAGSEKSRSWKGAVGVRRPSCFNATIQDISIDTLGSTSVLGSGNLSLALAKLKVETDQCLITS